MSHLDEGTLHALLDGELDLPKSARSRFTSGPARPVAHVSRRSSSSWPRPTGWSAPWRYPQDRAGPGPKFRVPRPLPSVPAPFQSIPGARGMGAAGSPSPRYHRAVRAASALDAALPMGCHDRCGAWGRPAGHECAASKRPVAGDRAGSVVATSPRSATVSPQELKGRTRPGRRLHRGSARSPNLPHRRPRELLVQRRLHQPSRRSRTSGLPIRLSLRTAWPIWRARTASRRSNRLPLPIVRSTLLRGPRTARLRYRQLAAEPTR